MVSGLTTGKRSSRRGRDALLEAYAKFGMKPPRKKADQREQRIQQALKKHLDIACLPKVAWFAIPNQRAEPETRKLLHSLGVKAGAPDLLFIVKGKAYGLEVKDFAGSQSPDQEWMEGYLTHAGARYAVGTGIDECLSILMDWGVLRKGYVPSRRLQAVLDLEAA